MRKIKKTKNPQNNYSNHIFQTIKNNSLIIILFIYFLFTRFYQLTERLAFGWDQVDNAWAVKSILVDHAVLLEGMVAKGNAGFHIGPAYYYLIAPIYALFSLDPIASGVIAGLTSVIAFWILYYCINQLFNKNVAFFSVFIYTNSLFIMLGDRIQWPVNFIAPVSMLVFYTLYKSVTKNSRYLLAVACIIGFSFHIHFTSIFYPLLIFLTLPLFKWTKKLIINILCSIPLFLVWFIPMIISEINSSGSQQENLTLYLNTNYHGFHLRRVLQLVHDAFIEPGLIIGVQVLDKVKYILVPLFVIDYWLKHKDKPAFVLLYLTVIWFVVPWFVFSTYRGEISNYYFFITRPVALMIIGYFLYRIYVFHIISRVIVVVVMLIFLYTNLTHFLQIQDSGYNGKRVSVRNRINSGEVIDFEPGLAEAYFYYVEKR